VFEKLLAHRDHIPPHRIWAFLTDRAQFDLAEHVHMLMCADCLSFADACLRAESFGDALGIWLSESKFDKAG